MNPQHLARTVDGGMGHFFKEEIMTTPGCKKSGRTHTPYTSKRQAIAGNIALAAREGKIPKSTLKGPSKQMAEGMTLKELKSHSQEAKGKKLPEKASGKWPGHHSPAKPL